MLFVESSFYHFLFCVSLCYSLFISSITFSYVILCFLIILLLSISVFPYVILCFFLLSLSLSVFPYVILVSSFDHLLLCYSLYLSFYHFLQGRHLAPLLKSSDLTSRCYNCERLYLPNTPKHAKRSHFDLECFGLGMSAGKA